MLLQLKQIKCHAFNRLKRNIGKAIGLVIITLITLAITVIIGQCAVLVLDSTLIQQGIFISPSVGTLVATLISLIVDLLIISPLILSVKKWYSTLRDCNPSFGEALSIFATFRCYISAVWYSFIKAALLFIYGVCLFLPTLIIAAVINADFAANGVDFGILTAVMLMLLAAFAILGIIYFFYVALGFFYADYIYLSNKTRNPFKVIGLSFRLIRHRRGKVLLVYCSLLHMWLLYLLIIPIIFVQPYVNSTLAFFANEQLDTL